MSGTVQCDWQFPSAAGSEHLKFVFKTNGTQSLAQSNGRQVNFEYLTASSPSSNEQPDIEVSAVWEGRALSIRFKWYNPDKRITEIDDRWSLSKDAKTLNIERGWGPTLLPNSVFEHRAQFVFENIGGTRKK
jgi:hypothetical protein